MLRRWANSLAALLSIYWLTAGGAAPPTLTFAFGGDINLARGAAYAGAFAPLQGALRADLVLANLESPLTDRPKSTAGIDLRAPLNAVTALRPFTHLGIENNHALDGGAAGKQQNIQTLQANQLIPVTRKAVFTQINGVTVALLAFLDDGQTPLPLEAIKGAAQKASIVIVMPHWGAEYGLTTKRQRQQARQLVQAGATLIVGSGPHVLQGHERIGKALVLYSLGNLLFDQPYPAAWRGAVVRVQVRGANMQVCAGPTFTRAGKVRLALSSDQQRALERLNLPPCPPAVTLNP